MSGQAKAFRPEPGALTRWLILGIVGLVFLVPIVAMGEFTLRRGLEGGYDFSRWIAVFSGGLTGQYKGVLTALGNSVVLAIVTVAVMLVILVPTMILVQLRFPYLRRAMEFLCLLPITIPAIVLVVGLAPVYSVIAKMFGSGVWTLSFAYGIIVLPYAYRAIQANLSAIDVVTLSEAARSLGAGWLTVLVLVLLPNLRRGILSASFISVAVVLGEYTIAALLNRINLQTALVIVSKSDPFVAVIFALLALVFAFLLLLAIGRVGAPRRSRREPAASIAAPAAVTPTGASS
jgi:putative spermidine/putrescine transport system permease protein